ncbi:hypothetical protein E3F72_10810 [Salmonella enterica]|nr:hypothetical protein [Salmonella enterica]
MLYGITKMRVGSMLNVYVICNNALVHKQYVIAYTTVIIIFGIVCYIGLLKLITKGKHEK